MNIAITAWGSRVSPLFDTAARLLIIPETGAAPGNGWLAEFDGLSLIQKCLLLKQNQVGLVICGAISRHYQYRLLASGIRLIPWICGHLDDVLNAYRQGRLNDAAYFMPGRRSPGLEAAPPDAVPDMPTAMRTATVLSH